MHKRYIIEAYDIDVEPATWTVVDTVNYIEEAYMSLEENRIPFQVFVRCYDIIGDCYLEY